MSRLGRRISAAFLLAVVGLASIASVAPQSAQAAAVAGGTASQSAPPFNKSLLMDNAVFEDTGTMTVAQIQAFLDSFPNSCIKAYKDDEPLGRSRYGPTKVPAAQVIYKSAQFWGVNPQVLLVTLEKEQTLVSGGRGCEPWRFWSAMGYGCPDGGAQYQYPDLGITGSGTCVSKEYWAGFARQVNSAAWQLQFNRQRADGNVDWNGNGSIPNYGFYTAGYRRQYAGAELKYYDGRVPIDGQAVTMGNGTTASLYTYTPHFAGNQTFVTLFTRWFGSTMALRVDYTDYVKGVYRVLLGRPADSSGLNYWTNFLNSGGSLPYFVNAIVTGTEYTVRTVRADYLLILQRAGEESGVAWWANQLATSRRNDLILAHLAGSDEYFNARSSGDVPTFVSNLYIDLLGRSIDGGGLTYWSGLVTARTLSRSGYALGLADSPEYAQRLVNSVYNLVLGRDAEPGGRQYWADRYVQTQDILQLVISLTTSAEGQAHLAAH